MLKSVKCELFKGFSQLKTVIFLIIIAGAPFVGSIGSMLLSKTSEIGNDPMLAEALKFSSLNLPLKMLNGFVDFLIPIFIIVLVADSFTEEYIHGTLKLPLISPMKRSKFLVSKIIAIGIEIAITLGVLLVSSYVAGFIFFGSTSVLEYGMVALPATKGILYTLGAYGMGFLVLLSFTIVIMVIAINFKSAGSVIAVSIGFIIGMNIIASLGDTLGKLMLGSYFKFFITLFLNVDNIELINGLLVIVAYGVVALIASVIMFKKKDIVH